MQYTNHMVIGLVLGAFILGYLVTEMTYQRMLSKAEYKLGLLADEIDKVVNINDAQATRITELEALLQLIPEES